MMRAVVTIACMLGALLTTFVAGYLMGRVSDPLNSGAVHRAELAASAPAAAERPSCTVFIDPPMVRCSDGSVLTPGPML